MTDELEHLRQALAREPGPKPDDAEKQRAIAHAVSAFGKKNLDTAQGSRTDDRLKEQAGGFFTTIFGRRPMRLSPALMGSASFAVLALAVLSTNAVLQNPFWEFTRPAPETKKLDTVATKLEEKRSDRKQDLANKQRQIVVERDAEAFNSLRRVQKQIAAAPVDRSAAEAPATESGYRVRRQLAPSESKSFADGRLAQLQQPTVQPSPKSADKSFTGGYQDQGRDRFTTFESNPLKVVTEAPVSTFSIDVDTASYAFVRSSLNRNVLPQKDAVRVEELINYFPYDYEAPTDQSKPFKSSITVMPTPWNAGTKLIHVGIKGFELQASQRPRANLVFLLDTSGSMNAPNKLPLLRNAMKLLLERLNADDTISIVTYAGRAGTVLQPTKAKDKSKILSALNNLHAGGSTAGGEGIRQAYQLAEQTFDKEAVNRVILATDGDFNVGIQNPEELKSFVERKRKSGVFLSVLGFGRGNYNDHLMQTLAQNGNGTASYIDTLNEARKVLVEETSGTLFTIAKDVKIQMEFNPATVSEYRLIGYETRVLKREDFNNDKVDAGDIGSGHTVTALYEITPKDSNARLVDNLRYGPSDARQKEAQTGTDEYAFLKIRYKLPEADTSELVTAPIKRTQGVDSVDAAPQEARFATSVAAFGQLLRGGRHTGTFSYDDVIALAQNAKGKDVFGYRSEFVNLARFAKSASALQEQK